MHQMMQIANMYLTVSRLIDRTLLNTEMFHSMIESERGVESHLLVMKEKITLHQIHFCAAQWLSKI